MRTLSCLFWVAAMPLELDDDDLELLGGYRSTWSAEGVARDRRTRTPDDDELRRRAQTRRENKLKRRRMAGTFYAGRTHG